MLFQSLDRSSRTSLLLRVGASLLPLLLLFLIVFIYYQFTTALMQVVYTRTIIDGYSWQTTRGTFLYILCALGLLTAECVPLLLSFWRAVSYSAGIVPQAYIDAHTVEAGVFRDADAIRSANAMRVGRMRPPPPAVTHQAQEHQQQQQYSDEYKLREGRGRMPVPAYLRGRVIGRPPLSSAESAFSDDDDDGTDHDDLLPGHRARHHDAPSSSAASGAGEVPKQHQQHDAEPLTNIADNSDDDEDDVEINISAATAASAPPLDGSLYHPTVLAILQGRYSPGPHDVRWCRKCATVKPPRAHHCSICNTCTLKMDHHCPWVGNCVGFGNYKFFVLLLIWGLAATLTTVLAWAPLFLGLWSPVRPAYPLPHHARFLAEAVRFLPAAVPGGDVAGGGGGIGIDDKIAQANAEFTFRHANTSRFLGFTFAVTLCLSLLAFVSMHVYLILKGSTTLESAISDEPNPYAWGAARNWALVMGSDWRAWWWPVTTADVRTWTLDGTDFSRCIGDTSAPLPRWARHPRPLPPPPPPLSERSGDGFSGGVAAAAAAAAAAQLQSRGGGALAQQRRLVDVEAALVEEEVTEDAAARAVVS